MILVAAMSVTFMPSRSTAYAFSLAPKMRIKTIVASSANYCRRPTTFPRTTRPRQARCWKAILSIWSANPHTPPNISVIIIRRLRSETPATIDYRWRPALALLTIAIWVYGPSSNLQQPAIDASLEGLHRCRGASVFSDRCRIFGDYLRDFGDFWTLQASLSPVCH